MQFPFSYTTQEKLKSLSERLRYLARDKNAYSNYIDQKIKSENLQYNLSLIISHIILKLHFIERSVTVFESIIEEYNESNNTNLTFENFKKIGWIRIISEDVVMPALVNHFIWQVGYYEKEGKPIEIPKDKTDIVRCLLSYYERCFSNARLTITQSELENVLNEYASKAVTIEFLKERGIIGFDAKSNHYYWQARDEYSRHLRNEIASTLWLLVGGENATFIEFKRFFKLIQGTQIWLENLDGYLTVQNTTKINELAIEFLNSENDLLKSEDEFRKIWLDAKSYLHVDIKNEIPDVDFNYDNTFDFIESVNYHKFRYHDAFDYQRTRSFYYSILKIIVNNESKYLQPFQNTLRILKDTRMPFLVWTLYSEIPSHFSFAIPYLLNDSDLIPIAFKLIDKIEIDNAFLKEQSNTDKTEEECCELKNQLWLEMFDFTLEQFSLFHSDDEGKGIVIAKILIDLAENLFKYNNNNRNSFIIHNSLRKRYDDALKKLSNQRIKQVNVYPKPFINPKIITSIFPYFVDYLKNKLISTFSNHTKFLSLKSAHFDLSIEILRLGNIQYGENEISEVQKLEETTKDLVISLKEYLTEFYSQNEIEVHTYNNGIEIQKAQRGVNEFGFEIIDWGYLFLHFERTKVLDTFHNKFTISLKFNTTADKYDDQNKEQFEKIKLYLKSLMIGFISINQKRGLYEFDGLPVNDTLFYLEKWIKELSLLYSINDLPQSRIDVFNEMFSVFGYDIYYQHLTSLLYKSINYFTDKNPDEFVETYFASSNDIGRMLTATNILDSKEQRYIISKRISEVKIETYIDEVFTTTELQYAVIEAVNSESHWELAKPLIDRIQAHFKSVQHHDENRENLLFQVNLLLAFKEKDFRKLISINIPQKSNFYQKEVNKMHQVKQFYIALFKLYNDKNYDNAIKLFKSLLTEDTKNIRYAFHIYRAETLKAIDAVNIELLNIANQNWESFVNILKGEEKKGLSELNESIASNSLHYFAVMKDAKRFDQTINTLSKSFVFDEEIIPTVYKFYIERDLHELAFDYIEKAKKYLSQISITIPANIQIIIDNSVSTKLLKSLKRSLECVRGINAKDIPLITPDKVNDKRNLGEFMLCEIVQASKVLIEKIHGIKKNPDEDRYNDLLLATLRLRFQIWDWSIHDQARKGTSPTGINAGETDITIESGNITIALFEALILRGKDKAKTENHVLKSFGYAKNLDRYYMIIYFKGKPTDLDTTWDSYKQDAAACSYSANFAFDIVKNFEDLSSKFDDINHLRIAKTVHGTNVEMFHVMIDLSE